MTTVILTMSDNVVKGFNHYQEDWIFVVVDFKQYKPV